MPADRLFHPRASRSRKCTMLTDLEFRVWWQYVLSADDFGVMRSTAVDFQAASNALKGRKPKALEMAIAQLIAAPLVLAFTHQDEPFICSPNWQSFQKIEYPRATDMPHPPDTVLAQCDEPTQALFRKWPGGQRQKKANQGSPEPFGTPSAHIQDTQADDIPTTRAGAPVERLTANANGLRPEANGERLDVAFVRFRDAYPEARRQGGILAQQAFIAQVARAGGSAALMAALENHMASAQWRNPTLVPRMDRWLTEERWRQTLPVEESRVSVKGPDLKDWRPAAERAR